MLFCETYQSTNLDSLKLLSFYFTIFLYSRQFLFRFRLRRLSFPVSKECKLQNLQNGSIWSLEMTFNYNHLYYSVMQWIKLEHKLLASHSLNEISEPSEGAWQSSDDKWEGPGGWRQTEQNNKVRGSVVRGCSQPGLTASSRVSSYAGAPRLSAISRGRDRLWPSKSPVSESRRWREGGRAATAMRHRELDQLHFSVACVRPTLSHQHQQSVSGTKCESEAGKQTKSLSSFCHLT